jgi:hypothetical protein
MNKPLLVQTSCLRDIAYGATPPVALTRATLPTPAAWRREANKLFRSDALKAAVGDHVEHL